MPAEGRRVAELAGAGAAMPLQIDGELDTNVR
jgi:hypothetical protein